MVGRKHLFVVWKSCLWSSDRWGHYDHPSGLNDYCGQPSSNHFNGSIVLIVIVLILIISQISMIIVIIDHIKGNINFEIIKLRKPKVAELQEHTLNPNNSKDHYNHLICLNDCYNRPQII